MNIRKVVPMLIAAAGLTFGAQGALAQAAAPETQAAPQTQPAPSQAAAQLDDETLDKFVSAYTEIQEIHQEYSGRLQEVTDAEKATGLQQEAQEKMQQAVTEQGLSVEEYAEVANQVSEDPELRARVTRDIMEALDS